MTQIKKTTLGFILILSAMSYLMISSCTEAQMKQFSKSVNDVNKTMNQPAPLTNDEVIRGLKEALSVGITNAGGLASKADGYFKNPKLFIPFPPEVKNVEDKLRGLGMNSLCDQFIQSVNRGAENAAAKAAPIFKEAITGMSISDGFQILRGSENAATEYLKKATTEKLKVAFRPVIEQSLSSVNATKYWSDVTGTYNKIPFVTKVNTDLPGYVTDRAIQGLFILVADEEAKIRKDPVARVSELLKRVFGSK